jgi:hypothetical protein
MLILALFFFVVLWLIGNHQHVKTVQRTNRLLRQAASEEEAVQGLE